MEKLSPVGRYDQYGKLAEEELSAVLADRNRSTSDGGINADTKVAGLVDQYLDRLEQDGRARVTTATYRFTTTKLKKLIGGLRVGESSPARVDAALPSMRNAHGATMARQSKTILRGALQLAVMASALRTNPVRDVQPLRSKSQPKGAVALTAKQLCELLINLPKSDFCRDHDLVDPIALLIATGLRDAAAKPRQARRMLDNRPEIAAIERLKAHVRLVAQAQNDPSGFGNLTPFTAEAEVDVLRQLIGDLDEYIALLASSLERDGYGR